MFMDTRSAGTLLASLTSLVYALPVARNNFDARSINWISPDRFEFCWEVEKEGYEFASGQALGVAACDDSPSQQFIYTTGATSIQLANANLCVESDPGLAKYGTPLKLEKCRTKGAPGQHLFFNEDHHVVGDRDFVPTSKMAPWLTGWEN